MLESLPRTLEWKDGALRLVDQRLLPHQLEFLDCRCSQDVCAAIAELAVRGAPAIGDAGAFAVALWLLYEAPDALTRTQLDERCSQIAAVRPTAVNLSWAVERCRSLAAGLLAQGAAREQLAAEVLALAQQILADDVESCRNIGLNALPELRALADGLGRPLRIETHCNAGSLATAFYGTATSVIYHGWEEGLVEQVWVDETRPVGQGARLTAWELMQAGVPCTLVCDNMAGALMQAGKVDLVVVGADRVCANGDFANKIGTYPLAVLAQHHGVPFYAAAPKSTFDTSLASGDDIVIEQRDPREVRCAPIAGGTWQPVAPGDVPVFNPAFDVTPHQLLAGIFTESGVLRV
ncbi:MAG: S-methyl-5-thioribose-1-phosphate isomerase [Coriobacteriales bacterium]